MYLTELEEWFAIFMCFCIVVGFIYSTIHNIKETISEEKQKFKKQKEEEEKVKEWKRQLKEAEDKGTFCFTSIPVLTEAYLEK